MRLLLLLMLQIALTSTAATLTVLGVGGLLRPVAALPLLGANLYAIDRVGFWMFAVPPDRDKVKSRV